MRASRSLTYSVFGLIAVLATATPLHSAQADSSVTTQASSPTSDDEIGIINLSDQDMTPELRNCLKHALLAQCLQKQAGKQVPQPTPTEPIPNQSAGKIEEDIAGNWRNFLYGAIVPADTVYTFANGAQINFGFNIGGDRLDFDEIAMDPNKLATEKTIGTPGVWVRHDFELMPQGGYGLTPGLRKGGGFYGGMVTANLVMHITKRHPMDQLYNKDFWGYTRSDLKIAGQALPMYLHIGTQMDGRSFLPGEGISFERYGTISIGIGPNISLTGAQTPVSFMTAEAGIFASAGLVLNFVRGHFRTEMEAQTDGTLRVNLQHINQDSERLAAEISAGADFGPLSFIFSLARVEAGVVHTHQTILDMVIDQKYPQAAHALHEAYMGFFGPLQKLALLADKDYQGVRDLAHSTVVQTAHERSLQILTYNRGSEISESKIDTDLTDATGADTTASNEITANEMSKHRDTSMSQRQLDIQLDIQLEADDHAADPLNHRTLSVKYKFHTDNAKPEELRELLDAARVLSTGNSDAVNPDISNWEAALETDDPKSKRGDVRTYFYLAFDPSVVSSVLGSSDPAKFSRYMVSWAQALRLPNASDWATMTPDKQDEAAKSIPGLGKHLKQLRKFLKAIAKTMKSNDVLGQDRTFAKEIRGDDFDLYPIAALAMNSDHSHLLGMERVTLTKNGAPQTLEVNALGDNYEFPPKTLH